LPSRLGDDPLARAGRGTARLAGETDLTVSASGLDSFGGSAPTQPEAQPDSNAAVAAIRRSFNDVFFLRRGEEGAAQPMSQLEHEVDQPLETEEISEVSEIPEIREVATAPIVGPEGKAADPIQELETTQGAGAQGTAADPSPETSGLSEPGQSFALPVAEVGAPVAPSAEPIAALPPPVDLVESGEVEPGESTGLLKKIFGKIEK
jgi:hypothetical protein